MSVESDKLAEWQAAYALECQWIDSRWENIRYWEHWEWLYLEYWYYPKFDWRSIREH